MSNGELRTLLLETVKFDFILSGYSSRLIQTTAKGTRTPNLQEQRTAVLGYPQLSDHVLNTIHQGRNSCRILLLAGAALTDEETIVEFLERCCCSKTTGAELLVNKGVRGYIAEYIMDRWQSQYLGCRVEVTNHFEDVTVSRVLLAIGGVSATEVLAQQSKSSTNALHDKQIDAHQYERERTCTSTICIQGDEGTTARSLAYLVTSCVTALLGHQEQCSRG